MYGLVFSQRHRPPGPVLGYEDGIPVVPVTVKRFPRKPTLLKLAACPYCGHPHLHGGGLPGEDPRDSEGHRVEHCVERDPGCRGYILRIVGEERGPDEIACSKKQEELRVLQEDGAGHRGDTARWDGGKQVGGREPGGRA